LILTIFPGRRTEQRCAGPSILDDRSGDQGTLVAQSAYGYGAQSRVLTSLVHYQADEEENKLVSWSTDL
jgi:hypothetical protein